MWWKILAAVGGLVLVAAVAVPIAMIRIQVDLPPAVSAAPPARACPPITIQIETRENPARLWVNGAPTTSERLLLDMAKVRKCSPDLTTVSLRADQEITYRDFMAVVDELQMGGYKPQLALSEADGEKLSN